MSGSLLLSEHMKALKSKACQLEIVILLQETISTGQCGASVTRTHPLSLGLRGRRNTVGFDQIIVGLIQQRL